MGLSPLKPNRGPIEINDVSPAQLGVKADVVSDKLMSTMDTRKCWIWLMRCPRSFLALILFFDYP